MIARDKYLNLLINSQNNGFPKVITGVRRCGKSFLLKEIYRSYLIDIYNDQYNYIGTEDNKRAHKLGLWNRVFTCQLFNSERKTVFS